MTDAYGPGIKRNVIAATYGWFLLTPIWENDRVVDLYREPIIAWMIETDEYGSTALPITADASYDDAIIVRPDGSMFAPAMCEFTTTDSAKQWYQDRAVMQTLAKVKKAADRIISND